MSYGLHSLEACVLHCVILTTLQQWYEKYKGDRDLSIGGYKGTNSFWRQSQRTAMTLLSAFISTTFVSACNLWSQSRGMDMSITVLGGLLQSGDCRGIKTFQRSPLRACCNLVLSGHPQRTVIFLQSPSPNTCPDLEAQSSTTPLGYVDRVPRGT